LLDNQSYPYENEPETDEKAVVREFVEPIKLSSGRLIPISSDMEQEKDLEFKEGVNLFDKATPVLKSNDSSKEIAPVRQPTVEDVTEEDLRSEEPAETFKDRSPEKIRQDPSQDQQSFSIGDLSRKNSEIRMPYSDYAQSGSGQ